MTKAVQRIALLTAILAIAGCTLSNPPKLRTETAYPERADITGIPGL